MPKIRSFKIYTACHLLLAASTMLLTACSQTDNTKLLRDEQAMSAELKRLRDLQMVRVVDHDGNPSETTAIAIVGGLLGYDGRCVPAGEHTAACDVYVASVMELLCVASYLEQAAQAETTATVVLFNPQPQREWKIPPQNANARWDMLRTANQFYSNAAQVLTSAITSDDCKPQLLQVSAYPDGNKETTAANFASLIGQLWSSDIRLAGEMAQLGASAADSQRGSAPTYAVGADRSIAGMDLSRAEVAHEILQKGAGENDLGRYGIAGSTNAPCRQAALDQVGLQALELFRTTGVAPADVLAMADFQKRLTTDANGNLLPGVEPKSVSTKAILDGQSGPGDAPLGPTVLARLKHDSKKTDLTSVVAETGIPLESFEKARIALGEELLAFGKLSEHRLDEVGVDPNLLPYAATRSVPEAMPPEYYAALVRTPVSCINCDLGDRQQFVADVTQIQNGGASDMTSIRNLMHLRWLAQRVSTGAPNVWLPNFFAYSEPAVHDIVAPALAHVLADDTIVGALSLFSSGSDSNQAYFQLDGFTSADKAIVVRGEQGLLCATRGTVYGQTDCDMTAAKVTPDFAFEADQFGGSQETFFDYQTISKTISLPNKVERWYLAVPRDKNSATPGRGDYKVLLGFVPNTAGMGLGNGQWWPISPPLEKLAGSVVEPQPDQCSKPAVDCSGMRYDARISLEDELSSDGTDVESSWKVYLQRAKDAAALSDELTQQYIQAGLSEDQWKVSEEDKQRARAQSAIAELDKLQNICGTAIDPEVLLDVLRDGSDDVDLTNRLGATCDGEDPAVRSDCFANRIVVAWQSLLDKNAAAKPLADCLRKMTERIAIVALGDTLPCAWRDGSGVVCGGSSEEMPCPIYTTNCGQENKPNDAAWIDGSERAALGIFAKSESGTFRSGKSLCERIRQARQAPSVYASYRDSLTSADFSLPSLASLRKRFSLETELGGYFKLKVDAHTVGTTGSTVGGPEVHEWPCGSDNVPPECKEDRLSFSRSFRCQTYDCTNPTLRGQANRRILDAYVATQVTTSPYGDQLPPLSIELPGYRSPQGTTSGNSTVQLMHDGKLEYGSVYVDSGASKIYTALPASFIPFTLTKRGNPNPSDDGIYYARTEIQHLDFVFALQPTRYTGDTDIDSSGEHLRAYTGDIASQIWDGMDSNSRTHDGFVIQYLAGGGITAPLPEMPDLYAAEQNYETRVGRQILDTFTLTRDNLLDATELICDVAQADIKAGRTCMSFGGTDGQVTNIEDVETLSSYLKCAANQINDRSAAASFINFPSAALDPLSKSTAGPYATESGELGQAYSELRQAAAQVALSGPILAGAIRGFGNDLQYLKQELTHYGIQDQISQVQTERDMASAAVACASGILSAMTTLGTGSGGVAAACGNMAVTAYFGQKLLDLQQKDTEVQRQMAMTRYQQAFSGYVTTLQTEEVKLREALETIRARLGKAESLKQDAARALNAAVWDLSKQSVTAQGVATVLGKQRTTAHERYVNAYDNALRLSFLSKRAIEQRLGMSLASMTEDLPLVDAPARWESSICASSPVDYATLQQDTSNVSYADTFIGDYVRKLENVVESYRQQYPFHDGTDVLVASLRDDIMNVKSPCEVKSRNLLLSASRMDEFGVEGDAPVTGWAVLGCTTGSTYSDAGTAVVPKSDCAVTARTAEAAAGSPVHTLSFNGNGQCSGGDCGWNPNVVFGQRVSLSAGKYILSWYTGPNDGLIPTVRTSDGTMIANSVTNPQPDGVTYYQKSMVFLITEKADYLVGFTKPSAGWSGVVAAPMLELANDGTEVMDGKPGFFEDSDGNGNTTETVCPDRDGRAFRATRWKRGCELLCTNGYGSNCSSTASKACYWETSVSIRQKDIERNTTFNQSGFARGNFNYRIQNLALNFVGTGMKSCDGTSQACYAGGFIPYTIIHEGPYYVRNHLGDDFEAKLFTGRIEHARGLAAERYISNPISTTDQSLLQNYLRPEFSGRPLDGTFIVRVWDENNVNFDAIQDVQLVMNYRYWTRFQ